MDSINTLLQDFYELNPPHIEVLTDHPSPLEFMRFVSLNRPFIIRSGARNWEATRCWNIPVLKQLLKGQSINVAITPHGNADSPTRNSDGELLFVKPWEERQDFEEFIDFVARQEKYGIDIKEVRYSQTRMLRIFPTYFPANYNIENDNLRQEYASLFPFVENNISWARIALQKDPEAINLWLGNSYSISALHKDNYENIFVQILGQKSFVLIPPIAYICVSEKMLAPASYVKRASGEWEIRKENGPKIPFPTWDTIKNLSGSLHPKISELVNPMKITLGAGDILYLPALWCVS